MWSRPARSLAAIAVIVAVAVPLTRGTATASKPHAADEQLRIALRRLVASPGGPPGAISVIQRDGQVTVATAGLADVQAGREPAADDYLRGASVAKAFSGAATLAVVKQGKLSLDDTIANRLPSLPRAWGAVTLAEALQHTSGVPDFSQDPRFAAAVMASPFTPPPPAQLLSFVSDRPLEFRPGSKYEYSNSDNVVAGLMIEAATGRSYEDVLASTVDAPLGLTATSLPRDAAIPAPFLHGYTLEPPSPPQDESESVFAMGWAWAAGGIISTPADLNRFIRGYASGATGDRASVARQFRFVKGTSDPPGPGTNSSGLAIFRYQARCGTVYGHTGNVTGGYTNFVAATRDGRRSAAVSVNEALTPKSDPARFPSLRRIYELAVCAAVAR